MQSRTVEQKIAWIADRAQGIVTRSELFVADVSAKEVEHRLKTITRRSRAICDRTATKFKGIPVATIPQILIDLAADLSLDDLARACHEAHVRGTRPEHVDKGPRAMLAELHTLLP